MRPAPRTTAPAAASACAGATSRAASRPAAAPSRRRDRSGASPRRAVGMLPTSKTVRMFGWLSAATARASRSKRASRSGSHATDAGSTLIATSRRSRGSRARYTSPRQSDGRWREALRSPDRCLRAGLGAGSRLRQEPTRDRGGPGDLLRARQLTFEDVDQIRAALERYAAGDGDLADWLIWERSRAAGAERA